MEFKAYDILSTLVPGFLILLALQGALNVPFENDHVVAYSAIAFLLGYMMNSFSSWLEDLYYFSWGGKPSSKLLDGKDIWKVRFYHSSKVKQILLTDSSKPSPSNDELFSIAMRHGNGQSDCRVDDFNAMYAFSRVLLTTALLSAIILLITHGRDWRYYAVLIPVVLACWLRCKQRAYYYAREVLNHYLKIKG